MQNNKNNMMKRKNQYSVLGHINEMNFSIINIIFVSYNFNSNTILN